MRVLITGAAGNLGSLLAEHLRSHSPHTLRLMIHRRDLPPALRDSPAEVVRADLGRPATLPAAVRDVDVIVHFAGVLFQARPERFLPVTNTQYFANLVNAAEAAGVARVILISFPHVEGPTSVAQPARGRMDAVPVSVHAATRLEEERSLMAAAIPTPVILRCGMVYGDGILMIDAARWLARHRLLGVWRERTQIHLISREDFCAATAAAIDNPDVRGIYHLGDDGKDSLQEFLELACAEWSLPSPWYLPLWLVRATAVIAEVVSAVTGCRAWITRDFITIGRVPYYGDTQRMKQDLLPQLQYPTVHDGKHTLRASDTGGIE